MDSQIKEQVEGKKEMVPGLMKRIQELEHNAVVAKDYNQYLDDKLDKVLEDRIVLRNENYKLKEKLNTQTRTQTNNKDEEECLACSA
jgi:regulator of replication initiation timing